MCYHRPLSKNSPVQSQRCPFGGCSGEYANLNLPSVEAIAAGESAWLKQRLLLASREGMDDIIAALVKAYENRAPLADAPAPAAAGAPR